MADTRYDTPEPFKVDIPERALIDLDERLRRWRPAPAIADNGSWASGTDPDFLAELVDYWRHGYDWQRCQEAINRWPNYLVDIGPQRLHFIREPGTEVEDAPRPLPLVDHPWLAGLDRGVPAHHRRAGPSREPRRRSARCLRRDRAVAARLRLLRRRRFATTARMGPIGPRAIAGLWHKLVHEKLNYRRPYGVQGGDWGAVVSSWLAFDHPKQD